MSSAKPVVVSMEPNEHDQYELEGELSFASVPDICDRIVEVIKGRSELIVNLAKVSRSDSAGVAMLLDWVHIAREQDVDIHFLNMPEQMMAIARVSGLDEILIKA